MSAKTHTYLIVILGLFLNACSVSGKYAGRNKSEFNYGCYTLSNDSLRMSVRFYYQPNFEGNSKLNRSDFRFYQQLVERNTQIRIKPQQLLYAGVEQQAALRTAIFVLPKEPLLAEPIADGKCALYPIQDKERQYLQVFCTDNNTNQTAINYTVQSYRFGSNYKAAPDPFDMASKAMGDDGNYLQAILLLQENEANYVSKTEQSQFAQASATFNAFVNNNPYHDQALSKLTSAQTPKTTPQLHCDSLAIALIKETSKDAQVVMTNENHWNFRHRYLPNLLLDFYWKQGFRYLGMEGVWEPTDSLKNRGFPIQSTGLYPRDPHFGNLIRNALEMGYTVFGYDSYEGNREQGQAMNLYAQTLKGDPKAKVLVHAGGGHFSKDSARRMMGYYFKQLSGVDAFLIQQLKPGDIGSHELCAEVDSVYNIVLINKLSEASMKVNPAKPQVDVVLPVPASTLEQINLGQELLMSVYLRKEYDTYGLQLIPVSNFLLSKGTDRINTSLPKEEYFILIRDRNNLTKDSWSINL